MKILVVDDEKIIVKGLTFNLQAEGYEVKSCYDGATAVDMVKGEDFDLVILDVMMPVMNGLEACVKIREFSDVPIIMLTAKTEDTDKLVGFDYGADDYITKPFNILEVKARIKAILKRSRSQDGTAPEDASPISSCGVTLIPERRVALLDGKEVDLTVKEYDLIELLMSNPGRVYSRENLLNLVWGYDYLGDARTVDVHVRRLREKLEHDSANPTLILTKWGVGYYVRK